MTTRMVTPPNSTVASTSAGEEASSSSTYFVESAWEWFERCELVRRQQRQLPDEPPTSPTAAAWAFFRGSSCLYGGTGNPFVDEALQKRPLSPWKQPLPLLEIKNRHGSSRTGKTHSLVSLAAKFVVSTRASLFPLQAPANDAPRMPTIHKQQLPQVILLDSEWDITVLRLAHAVSSQLMLHPPGPPTTTETEPTNPATTTTNDNMTTDTTPTIHHPLLDTERDMEDCLSRIHMARVDEDREWIPILEALRHELLGTPKQQHDPNHGIRSKDALVRGDEENEEDDVPTLLLWDGFLGNNTGRNQGLEKEIARQLALLLQECNNIGFICTTTGGASRTTESRHVQLRDLLEDKSSMGPVQRNRHPPAPFVARTIFLERDERPEAPHGFLATVVEGNQQIPYSLSSAGVLP